MNETIGVALILIVFAPIMLFAVILYVAMFRRRPTGEKTRKLKRKG